MPTSHVHILPAFPSIFWFAAMRTTQMFWYEFSADRKSEKVKKCLSLVRVGRLIGLGHRTVCPSLPPPSFSSRDQLRTVRWL